MKKLEQRTLQELSMTIKELSKVNNEIDKLSQHRTYLQLKIKKVKNRLNEQER